MGLIVITGVNRSKGWVIPFWGGKYDTGAVVNIQRPWWTYRGRGEHTGAVVNIQGPWWTYRGRGEHTGDRGEHIAGAVVNIQRLRLTYTHGKKLSILSFNYDNLYFLNYFFFFAITMF